MFFMKHSVQMTSVTILEMFTGFPHWSNKHFSYQWHVTSAVKAEPTSGYPPKYQGMGVDGPCLLDYLILELILPVILYAASPLTLAHLSAKI